MTAAVLVRGVAEDGAVELEWVDSGEVATAELAGIRPHRPLPDLYRAIVGERVGRSRRVLAEHRGTAGGRPVVRLLAWAWQDKSGDVYEDVGELLLRERLADVAPGDFPERDAYEAAARD